MRLVLATLALLLAHPGWAAETVVKDGSTLRVGGTTWKLAGVDAPEFDQLCVDQKADPWTCGVEAREQLAGLIGGRALRCEDDGPAPKPPARRSGVCTIAGETESLNQRLVRLGWALASDAGVAGRFAAEQAEARDARRGLWKGCFAAPADFRRWKADAPLLGASCRDDKQAELRKVLFPAEPVMPPGCSIKGKLAIRARVTGHVGVYHVRGCRSYAALSRPNRWFCSEDDARAAGFRKAYNCGNAKPR